MSIIPGQPRRTPLWIQRSATRAEETSAPPPAHEGMPRGGVPVYFLLLENAAYEPLCLIPLATNLMIFMGGWWWWWWWGDRWCGAVRCYLRAPSSIQEVYKNSIELGTTNNPSVDHPSVRCRYSFRRFVAVRPSVHPPARCRHRCRPSPVIARESVIADIEHRSGVS